MTDHVTGEVEAQVEAQVDLPTWQVNVLRACLSREQTGRELLTVAGYASRTGNFKKGLQRLLDSRLLILTIPDKPNSRMCRTPATPSPMARGNWPQRTPGIQSIGRQVFDDVPAHYLRSGRSHRC